MIEEAVDRTMILFDARRPPAGEMPVILASGASGILLHEAIGHGMEADFNRKGTSIYSDMIGKKVAEPFITIVDQATIPQRARCAELRRRGQPCRTYRTGQGRYPAIVSARRNQREAVRPQNDGLRTPSVLQVLADAPYELHVHGGRPAHEGRDH